MGSLVLPYDLKSLINFKKNDTENIDRNVHISVIILKTVGLLVYKHVNVIPSI